MTSNAIPDLAVDSLDEPTHSGATKATSRRPRTAEGDDKLVPGPNGASIPAGNDREDWSVWL